MCLNYFNDQTLKIRKPLLGLLICGWVLTCVASPSNIDIKNQVTQTAATNSSPLVWQDLGKSHQATLAPLSKIWNELSIPQRRKWFAIAQNFSKLATSDQQKIHARMADWALLSRADREQARLNFAATKKHDTTERSASWEAYQTLSNEEKNDLAKKSPSKPAGAAVAIKPANERKITTAPATRNSPEAQRSQFNAQKPIDRKTLLPVPVAKSSSELVPVTTSDE